MRTIRLLSALTLAGFVLFAAVPGEAQSGRVAKKAAKEATKDAAGDDAKLKEAIPADVLTKLEGKVTVKPKAK